MKLVVGQPGDVYEQEADRVTDAVGCCDMDGGAGGAAAGDGGHIGVCSGERFQITSQIYMRQLLRGHQAVKSLNT